MNAGSAVKSLPAERPALVSVRFLSSVGAPGIGNRVPHFSAEQPNFDPSISRGAVVHEQIS